MKLKEIVEKLALEVRTKIGVLDSDVQRGYASDLLSDVLANAGEGDLWITLQVHQNIAAVAGMKGLSGIVLINSREPEEMTIRKAEEEKIPIMVSKLTAFELIGRLYNLGITGKGNAAKGI
jgi:hypothetical protein